MSCIGSLETDSATRVFLTNVCLEHALRRCIRMEQKETRLSRLEKVTCRVVSLEASVDPVGSIRILPVGTRGLSL